MEEVQLIQTSLGHIVWYRVRAHTRTDTHRTDMETETVRHTYMGNVWFRHVMIAIYCNGKIKGLARLLVKSCVCMGEQRGCTVAAVA